MHLLQVPAVFGHNSPSGIELLGGDFILNEWMHLAEMVIPGEWKYAILFER